MKEDGGSVLGTDVRYLAIHRGGIMGRPEDIEQLLVVHLLRVIGNLNDFGMAGLVGADILVGGIVRVAAQIAHGRVDDAGYLTKGFFHSPKASSSKCCRFHDGSFLHSKRVPASGLSGEKRT